MADWDEDSPSDSDFIAQYPANERAARAALVANFSVDHQGIDGDDIGKHKKVTLLNQSTDPTATAGQGYLYTKAVSSEAELFWRSSTGNAVQLTAAGGLRAESLVGTIADARLSSNVPLKNAPNTFTSAQTISTTLIWQYFRDSDAGENEKLSRLQAGGPGIIWATRTDEDGTGETWLSVQRNGVEVTEIELNADALDFNGNADISGTLAVGGAATFSNNVTVGGTISGNGSGLTSLNASNLSSGTVPDARLSSNVPLLNASNTYTGPATFSATAPRVEFFETDVGTDEGRWRLFAADGRFGIQARDDGSTVGSTFMAVSRSGTTVTEVELNADDIDINGNADISGTLSWGGGNSISSSNNVALLNATNTFTAPLTISTNNQWLYFLEADAGENEKLSRIQGAGGGLLWATRTDADGTGETWLSVQRNGVEVTEIELNADLLDFNGNADISGTLAVGGTITGNGSGLTSLNASNLSSGTVPGARLGGNQTMAGNKTFSDSVTIVGAARAGTAATSTSSTLAAGQIHHRSSNTTVPSMNAGQWVAVQNTGTSSITLSEGSGVTLELGGTTTTGNRTLLAKGFAFIYFRANGVGVVHGSGVT